MVCRPLSRLRTLTRRQQQRRKQHLPLYAIFDFPDDFARIYYSISAETSSPGVARSKCWTCGSFWYTFGRSSSAARLFSGYADDKHSRTEIWHVPIRKRGRNMRGLTRRWGYHAFTLFFGNFLFININMNVCMLYVN